LKLNRTLLTLTIIFVVTVSFAAVIQKQKNTSFSSLASHGQLESLIANQVPFNQLTFPTYTNLFSSLFSAPSFPSLNVAENPTPVFNNSTRIEIYDFVKANPGVQFRGICNELGLSIGVAQFHLGVLTKAGLISFLRDGKYKRFFESKRFSKKQMRIIALLRHNTASRILRTILERKKVPHAELAQMLSITSQGLTWQMNSLEKEGLIQENKEGMRLTYSLENNYAPMLAEMYSIVEHA
jgi:DNA-binding transcriptional ArsR family regulator